MKNWTLVWMVVYLLGFPIFIETADAAPCRSTSDQYDQFLRDYEKFETKSGSKDFKEHFRLMLPHARCGLHEAQFEVASMYDEGWGVNRDLNKAIYWYKRSVENGNYRSAINLSIYYAEMHNKKGRKLHKLLSYFFIHTATRFAPHQLISTQAKQEKEMLDYLKIRYDEEELIIHVFLSCIKKEMEGCLDMAQSCLGGNNSHCPEY